MKRDFDTDVLHAVCIEQFDAHSKTLRMRVSMLRHEETSIGCLYNALSRLENLGLVWSEVQCSNGVDKPHFYPTKEGLCKDKKYLFIDRSSDADELAPEYNYSES